MKINHNVPKWLAITVVSVVSLLSLQVWNTSRSSDSSTSESTSVSARSLSSLTEPDYFITERQDFGTHLSIDVDVRSDSHKEQLQQYLQDIIKEVKPIKGLTIWFYNGDKTFGFYDSRNRNNADGGLGFEDTDPPFPKRWGKMKQ